MLRLFDENWVDVTDERQHCEDPSCLGEPWCSSWGICTTAQEPQQAALMEHQQDVEFDHILSQPHPSSTPFPFADNYNSSILDADPYSSSIDGSSSTSLTSSTSIPQQRFAEPKTNSEVSEARKNAIPKKTRQDTAYCIRVWEAWRANRNTQGSSVPLLLEMDPQTVAHWLIRLVLEARKVDGSEYPPNTLHHIICGIMRHLQSTTMPGVDFFKDAEFTSFRSSLDAEMKRLQSTGIGSTHKQAEPLTVEEEELLWEKGILGGLRTHLVTIVIQM